MLMELFFGYVQQIIIDPEGEFSSLREKFGFVLATAERDDDGKLMGDIEADPNTADALALTALRTRASLIVDISELKVTERQIYVARFVEQLVNAPRELWHPALIWIDEAHDYAGESGHRRGSSESPEDSSLQALRDLASKGRKRGFAICTRNSATRETEQRRGGGAQELHDRKYQRGCRSGPRRRHSRIWQRQRGKRADTGIKKY